MAELIDAETHRTLVASVEVIPAFSLRGARGLLGRGGIPARSGLLLSDPLGCIHTVGMRFAIDIVFLDRDLRVVGLAERVGPWRLCRCRRSRFQLELAAGTAAERGLAVGRRVVLRAAARDEGGRATKRSPHAHRGIGEPAHAAPDRGCTVAARLPSVPPPGGQSPGTTTLPERSSPCARIC